MNLKDLAGVQPDPQMHRGAVVGAERPDFVDHRMRRARRGFGMIGARIGKAEGDHVRIANRLDLFSAEAMREIVEYREDRIQKTHEIARRLSAGHRSEADDVGE